MSIFGMAIYNLMLDRPGAGRASSGFFVVPGASAVMGFWLLNEHLSPVTIAGLIASTIGVVLVVASGATNVTDSVRTPGWNFLPADWLHRRSKTEDDHDVR